MKSFTWAGPADIRAGRILDKGAINITPGSSFSDYSKLLGELGLGAGLEANSVPAWSRKKRETLTPDVEIPALKNPSNPLTSGFSSLNSIANGETTRTDGISGMAGRGQSVISGGGSNWAFGLKDKTPSTGNMAWGGSGMSAW